MVKKEMIAMLLAGGQGSRLGILTAKVAKPAVAFGGKYRIIDFPLSNCINSGVDTVGVLTQYQPFRLNTHIGIGIPWDLDRNVGGVSILPPYEKSTSSEWYTGTANAIYQNLDYMESFNPDYVLILSGDHIYKMDYEVMLDFHKANHADVTIAAMPVPIEEASRFGIVITDDNKQITEFEEKPAHPRSNLASMGIYIFSWPVLKEALIALSEGKGKITDMLAEKADIIIRFQGGANAGHTIINDYGKFALHTLPSGVFYGHTTSVIGNGVALDIPVLVKEIQSLVDRGVPTPKILVSDRAQMVMSYHKNFDAYEEERLGGKSFGSTKSGIAPFYSDKYAKIGFQVSELFDDELLKEKAARVAEQKNVLLEHLYHKPAIDPEDLYKELVEYREMISPYVCNVSAYLAEALKEGKEILLEGQLGTLKDPDHGIYPMVTSSSTLAAYGAIGAGIPPYEIKKIITVCKAYSSAVGAGAFVSEIFGDEADELRRRGGDGGEFGATTGRPRRMGWFDCVASKYGCRLQGATDVAFTVVDVLGYLDEIPVCVGYEIDGEVTTEFPATHFLEKAKPVIKKLPGWKCDIRGIKKYEELPENCRNYIEFIEKEIGFPITMVSNGPGRHDIIFRK